MVRRRTSVRRYRAYRSSRKRSGMRFPVAVLAGFVPTVIGVYNRRGSATQIAQYLQAGWTGIGSDGRFNFTNLRSGALPVVMGILVHKAFGALGGNRAIASSGLKWLRV